MICSVEYRQPDGSWWMGHKGVDLKNPEAYAKKSGARVREVRACSVCPEEHRDGSCLL